MTNSPCTESHHGLSSTDTGATCPCGLVVVRDDGIYAGGLRVDLRKVSPLSHIAGEWTFTASGWVENPQPPDCTCPPTDRPTTEHEDGCPVKAYYAADGS